MLEKTTVALSIHYYLIMYSVYERKKIQGCLPKKVKSPSHVYWVEAVLEGLGDCGVSFCDRYLFINNVKHDFEEETE